MNHRLPTRALKVVTFALSLVFEIRNDCAQRNAFASFLCVSTSCSNYKNAPTFQNSAFPKPRGGSLIFETRKTENSLQLRALTTPVITKKCKSLLNTSLTALLRPEQGPVIIVSSQGKCVPLVIGATIRTTNYQRRSYEVDRQVEGITNPV